MLNANAHKNYTASGDRAAEELLKRVLSEMGETLSGTELCVVLGGSYGRGDGGVRQDRENGILYNDLDFFVFSRAPQKKDRILLDEIARRSQTVHGGHLAVTVQLDALFLGLIHPFGRVLPHDVVNHDDHLFHEGIHLVFAADFGN